MDSPNRIENEEERQPGLDNESFPKSQEARAERMGIYPANPLDDTDWLVQD